MDKLMLHNLMNLSHAIESGGSDRNITPTDDETKLAKLLLINQKKVELWKLKSEAINRVERFSFCFLLKSSALNIFNLILREIQEKSVLVEKLAALARSYTRLYWNMDLKLILAPKMQKIQRNARSSFRFCSRRQFQ